MTKDKTHAIALRRLRRQRLAIAVAVGLALAFALPEATSLTLRLLAGWDAGLIVYLGGTWHAFLHPHHPLLAHLAAQEDESPPTFLALVVAAVLGSVVAIFILLREVKGAHAGTLTAAYGVPLAVATLALSWLLLHTVFIMHYAHAFYGDDDDDGQINGGLSFATDRPSYKDFMFYAFAIGAGNQPPGMDTGNPRIRDLTTAHSVLSFLFNTVLLALAISIASNAMGS